MFKLIKRKIKQFFCKHEYIFSGDHWNTRWTCTKCGKEKIDW